MAKLDYIVMAAFGVLIFFIGLVFTRTGNKSGQAFFEAGSETPWWINGLSLFISYFSAGTFVVWGSIAYLNGLVANVIQMTMAISGLVVTVFIASRWRRAGVTTGAEYVGKRFGSREKRFYTFLVLIYSLFTTAAVLYPVGKMVEVVSGLPLNWCITVIGVIIILYTAAGGLWAVLVTDVVQFVILSAAVLIVIPAATREIGGIQHLISRAPSNFFKPFNSEYTIGFMFAYVIYQIFYIGGNWSYVQRYTSVATGRDSKKVAGLFTVLYLICPVVWMLPPMIYRVINPGLHGLQAENAYILMIQRVMPAGLIGLVVAGMVSATSSKANTTINMAATVFAQDIYKSLFRPASSDREVIWIARIFTLLFGVSTVGIAIWIPSAGGIVEVVLSTASIAGSALFGPLVWSLFSRRQTGFSVVTATLSSILVNGFLKVVCPFLFGLKLDRTSETILGVGIPLLVLLIFEVFYTFKKQISQNEILMNDQPADLLNLENVQKQHFMANQQNVFGVRVIASSLCVIGTGIIILGCLSNKFVFIVNTIGSSILLAGCLMWFFSKRATS